VVLGDHHRTTLPFKEFDLEAIHAVPEKHVAVLIAHDHEFTCFFMSQGNENILKSAENVKMFNLLLNIIDFIAMATHGRGEVSWILGSTAEKVVTHATAPTLLFRVMETRIPEFKDSQKWRLGMP